LPKMKTHKGAAKRFKVTGSGKIIRRRAFKSHLLEKKSAKRKGKLSQDASVSPANLRSVRRSISCHAR
jgi:large subunit ribosomal protein L35